MSATARIDDLLDLDAQLTPEDKELRETVRRFGEQRLRPHIAEWFESGRIPVREIAKEFGELGVLGMHLTGYGCAGVSAVEYGLACLELEAADSGLRSLVSVQGSLAMYAIWRFGSEEQKERWLPSMASGDAIGCFGLTEPDHGSDPAGMRARARRDGTDWVLDARKMWITNGSVADVAVVWAGTDDGVRGFVVPTDTPGFSAPLIKHKLSLRASVTSELVLDGVRLPASYANFYVANGKVLVPTFNDPQDRVALGILAELFPDRTVVGIHAVDLVWGLGTLHCLSQQEPAAG